MTDKELLKMLGITNKTIDITLEADIETHVKRIVEEYLQEFESKEKEEREKFCEELKKIISTSMQKSMASMSWYGRY